MEPQTVNNEYSIDNQQKKELTIPHILRRFDGLLVGKSRRFIVNANNVRDPIYYTIHCKFPRTPEYRT